MQDGWGCWAGGHIVQCRQLHILTVLPVPAGMLSMDGRCKTLDSGADGYVRSEDCIIFLLGASPLDSASNSGTTIRGSAINQDGRSSSLTAPNGPSQQQVCEPAGWSSSSCASCIALGRQEDCALWEALQRFHGPLKVHLSFQIFIVLLSSLSSSR